MQSMIIIYTTVPTKAKAEEIVHHLLERRLIACANIVQSESAYWWESKITKATEYIVLGKTIALRYEEAKDAIKVIHPHTVPCILKLDAVANDNYADWLKFELSN